MNEITAHLASINQTPDVAILAEAERDGWLTDGDLAALTLSEQAQLAHWESVISRSRQRFLDETTVAFKEIRDRRLYRTEYSTFEDYCRERWGMQRHYANRLIAAAEVVGNLVPIGTIPANEAQARPLTKLEPDLQREAWRQVVETAPNGKVTAAHVEEVVEAIRSNGHNHTMRVMTSSASPEWYTPTAIVDRVLDVFGEIDTDPCSNSHEYPNVPARLLYTKDDDGLSKPWRGRVYMNPPYGDEIGDWVEKMIRAYQDMEIVAAIALLPARTDTKWFRPLWNYCLCCLINGRLRFQNSENSAPFPSVVAYMGPNEELFAEAFEAIGTLVKKWNR